MNLFNALSIPFIGMYHKPKTVLAFIITITILGGSGYFIDQSQKHGFITPNQHALFVADQAKADEEERIKCAAISSEGEQLRCDAARIRATRALVDMYPNQNINAAYSLICLMVSLGLGRYLLKTWLQVYTEHTASRKPSIVSKKLTELNNELDHALSVQKLRHMQDTLETKAKLLTTQQEVSEKFTPEQVATITAKYEESIKAIDEALSKMKS